MTKARGVALILVLMVTGVLSLLILQISLTTREHVSRSQRLLYRAEAYFGLQSANASLMFAMATQPWSRRANAESENEFASRWNFRGTPFEVGGVAVSIQDLSGLWPYPQPGGSTAGFASALVAAGLDQDTARLVVARVGASQAHPNLVPLQDPYELGLIGGLSAEAVAKVTSIATLYPTRAFNPATAPLGALAARFSGSQLQGLISLREQNQLDETSFFGVTGLGGDEFITFFPGPGFRISTTVSFGRVSAFEEVSLSIDPYATEPFVIWSRRRPEIGAGVQ